MTIEFQIIAMTLISKVKVKYTFHLFMARSAQISLIFPPMVLLFWHNDSLCCMNFRARYDLGVKDQGQI